MVAIAVEPRIRAVSAWDESLGDQAIELAERAGLDLFEWQRDVLRDMLAIREDGRWPHFEFCLNVARQNGKGAVLEARELALLGGITDERFGVHSAHEFRTSEEHFMRVVALVEESGLRIKTIRRSEGREAIEMMDRRRLRFMTRTKSGMRGFAGVDYANLDEAMIIKTMAHGTMLPTLRASDAPRGPQVVYTGSAADQQVHEHSVVWSKLRERGLKGDDDELGYLEFSVDAEHPDDLSDEQMADRENWYRANPSLGILITEEHMAREYKAMDRRAFAVELLGVGDYPATDGGDDTLISPEEWADIVDEQATLLDPVCIAFDISPERHSSVVAAGRNDQGHFMVEVVHSNAGTGWVAERLAKLYKAHEVAEVVCDGFGPAAAVAKIMDDAGITVRRMDSGDYGKACGFFVDAVGEKTLRHLSQLELDHAVKGARARPLVDRWAWSRTKSNINISPLVAATLALWAAHENDVGTVEIF